MPMWLRKILTTFAEQKEGWPNDHRSLIAQVARAAGSSPGSLCCAAQSRYLPHGGRDELWLTLSQNENTVTRVRTPYNSGSHDVRRPVHTARKLSAQEAEAVRHDLDSLGIWFLPPYKAPSFDGWVCAVAIADGERLHSIQMHNPHHDPPGAHAALAHYLFALAPLPNELSAK